MSYDIWEGPLPVVPNERKPPLHWIAGYRERKLGRHVTVRGQGIIGRLITKNRKRKRDQ